MDRPDPSHGLTDRQREILRLLLKPMTSKEIARVLGISGATVDTHIRDAKRVLGVSSRLTAARILEKAETTQSYSTTPPALLAEAPTGKTLDEPIDRPASTGFVLRDVLAEPSAATSPLILPPLFRKDVTHEPAVDLARIGRWLVHGSIAILTLIILAFVASEALQRFLHTFLNSG